MAIYICNVIIISVCWICLCVCTKCIISITLITAVSDIGIVVRYNMCVSFLAVYKSHRHREYRTVNSNSGRFIGLFNLIVYEEIFLGIQTNEVPPWFQPNLEWLCVCVSVCAHTCVSLCVITQCKQLIASCYCSGSERRW